MSKGWKIFAIITVVDGQPVVELADNYKYMVAVSPSGSTYIVEKKLKEYCAIGDRK